MFARPFDSAIVAERAPWSTKCSVVTNVTAAERGSAPSVGFLVADGRNGDSMLSSVTDGIGPQGRRPGVMLIDAKEQLSLEAPWLARSLGNLSVG